MSRRTGLRNFVRPLLREGVPIQKIVALAREAGYGEARGVYKAAHAVRTEPRERCEQSLIGFVRNAVAEDLSAERIIDDALGLGLSGSRNSVEVTIWKARAEQGLSSPCESCKVDLADGLWAQLDLEAASRGVSRRLLVAALMECVINDDLFAAVLDGKLPRRKRMSASRAAGA